MKIIRTKGLSVVYITCNKLIKKQLFPLKTYTNESVPTHCTNVIPPLRG